MGNTLDINPSVHMEHFNTVYVCLPLHLLVFKVFLISCFYLKNMSMRHHVEHLRVQRKTAVKENLKKWNICL
jgi:hypothetical protein